MPALFFGLLVLLMLPAITAVLAHTESIRVILLVFHAGVIATLTAAACQRDDDPVVLLGQGPNSYATNLNARRGFSSGYFMEMAPKNSPEKKDLLGGVK